MKRLTSILLTLALCAFVVSCDDDPKNKNNTNNTNNANCGNGVIDDGETCDGTSLGTADCTTEGFTGGVLGCLADCSDYDTTGCTNVTNNTTPGHVGDPCSATDQCVTPDATCYDEVGYGLPSGYCVAECDAEGACTEDGSMCVSAGGASFCARTCALGGNDCRVGYECVDIGETVGICWAACTSAEHCPTTGICDAEAGFCVTPPEVCDNTVDDDMDGDVDCDDDDCASLPACGCTEDTFENHDGGSAYAMDLGTIPSSLAGHICGPANEDWFEITPSVTFAGMITLAFTNANGDLDLTLMDDAFAELDSSAGVSDTEVIEYTFEAGTTYYVLVEGYAGATGAYTLTVDYQPAVLEAVIVANPVNGVPGGSVALDVTLNNIGGLDAPGVAATLTTTDADVTIDDGTATFGDIVMGGTADNTADALTFTIAATHKNNQPVNLTLEVTDTDGGTWSFPVSVPVPFASLTVADLDIDDASGNNDGYADPGETPNLNFNVENEGSLAATGPVTVAITVDAASTVTGATVTPSGTECTAADLAAGASVACPPAALAIPAGAANGETVVLNFAFTDAAANVWNVQKTIVVGPASYTSILPALDPTGDHDTAYPCDITDLQAYVDASGVLFVKLIFASACTPNGVNDIYVADGTSNYVLTLTLEAGAATIWSNSGTGSWVTLSNPSSYSVTTLSGSTSEIVYSIQVSQIPQLTIANSLNLAAAVTDDLNVGYTDYAPDTDENGYIVYGTLTW